MSSEQHRSIPFRIAGLVMRHRIATVAFFVVTTLFFGYGALHVRVATIFSDLLPADDPFVQIFKNHKNFGNPLTVTIMVKRTDGKTIFNPETLKKVYHLTRAIDLAPAVDHTLILSVAATGARFAEATPQGIHMRPVMGDHAPTTPEEVKTFRQRVKKAPGVRQFLISKDKTAALIKATFIENLLDYGETFQYVRSLVKKADDAHHDIYLAGNPVLVGWVYKYQSQMLFIFGV
ncbi:MAG: hypothetical protein L0H83_14600, partial [Salinisphaera sp.]|nr:hypothetical protein [Salinisphaera sp.]